MPFSSHRSRFVAASLALVCAIALPGPGPSVALAQEIPGRRLQDIYIVARFNDGYWEWYQDYLPRRDAERQRITEIRLQLGVIAAERKKLRAEWLRFLYLENQLTPASEYDPGWSPYWESLLGVSSAGDLAGEMRREVDDIAFRWSAGIWGAPLVSEETVGRQLEASYQGERDLRRTRINEWKETERQLIDEALALNRDLAARCAKQKEQSGERRPWLNAEAARLDDEQIILRLQLYDAAQWYLPDELPALVAALDLDNTATEEVAALLRAKVHLATAAWNDEKTWLQMTSPRQAPPDPQWIVDARRPRLEAIAELRRVLQLNPDSAEARGMLIDAELWWLREMAAKLDLESRASLRAFGQYLSARGFDADQPQAWYQHAFEVITAVWGLGPIALAAAAPEWDVPGAQATELDITQTSAARNQVSLLAIMRLVKNGAPLAEIPAMAPADVAKRMTMHTAEGRPLPADQASRVVQDIRDTFRDLDDLRLLASADLEHLAEDVNQAFGKVYYAPLDPSYTWYESVGDLLNVHNIALLWGPGAIQKIGGQWAGVGLMSGSEIQALEQAGQLVTGRQAFLGLTRLDKLAETIAGTSVGSRMLNVLAADRAAMAGQGTVTTLANMGARLSSAMILYSGATYLGTEAGIPGAGLLVEILGEVGPVQMLSDIAARAQVPLEELATRVDEFGEFLVRQTDELDESRRLLDEVSGLAGELGDEAADATRQAAIQARLREIAETIKERGTKRAAGSVAEPVDEATEAAARALQAGNPAEARRAAAGGVEIANAAADTLEVTVKKVAAVAGTLGDGAQAGLIKLIPPSQLKTIRQLYGEGLPESFWRPDLYGQGEIGRSLQLGDEAIRGGDLDQAKAHFETAERLIKETGYNPRFRIHRDFAQERFTLVVNAQRLRDDVSTFRQFTPPSNASVDIDETAAAEVLESFDRELAAGAKPVGSGNDVYLVHDNAGNAYYVKQVPKGQAFPEDIDLILSSEAASSGLARRLDEIERGGAGAGYEHMGLSSPAMRYDPERQLLITRAIPSGSHKAGELADKAEYVTLALKQEYAKQRLFRAWLGDSDGHLRNMIIGDDGRVYMIDFDMATLSGVESRQITHEPLRTEGEVLSDTVAFWATLETSEPKYAMYKWMARLDQTITYADVKPTVDAIQELVGNPAELRRILEEAGYPDVDGAVRSLTERASHLEEIMQPLLDGGLLGRTPAAGPSTSGRVSAVPSWSQELPRAA